MVNAETKAKFEDYIQEKNLPDSKAISLRWLLKYADKANYRLDKNVSWWEFTFDESGGWKSLVQVKQRDLRPLKALEILSNQGFKNVDNLILELMQKDLQR